jgi:4-amino-4-deoxy-L-arabinose transferase-like glycosyltransferase
LGNSSGTARQTLLWMVVVAFALRLAVMPFVYSERINPARDYWRFGGETGRIARSIVEGKGFGNPFFADTGPTAWLTPVFPYLLAGVFEIFGIYTKASALAILSLDCLFSALTCIPVFYIARKHFGERTALWAGWIWAFFPYAIYFSANFIWDTALTTLLLPILYLIAIHLEESPKLWRWAGFGAFAGFAALTNAVTMSVAPFLGLWAWWRLYRRRQGENLWTSWFAPGAAAVFAVLIVTAPWFMRNYRVFHAFVPFRDNLGMELYIGNNGQTWHFAPSGHHPSDSATEWNTYQQLGETGYVASRERLALDYIQWHPLGFVWLSARRAVYMWTSFWSFSKRYLATEPLDPPSILLCTALTILAFLGLRRAIHSKLQIALPYVIVFALFPVVYYFTHPEDYYRRPMEPFLVILAAYAIVSRFRASANAAEEAGR